MTSARCPAFVRSHARRLPTHQSGKLQIRHETYRQAKTKTPPPRETQADPASPPQKRLTPSGGRKPPEAASQPRPTGRSHSSHAVVISSTHLQNDFWPRSICGDRRPAVQPRARSGLLTPQRAGSSNVPKKLQQLRQIAPPGPSEEVDRVIARPDAHSRTFHLSDGSHQTREIDR